MSRRIPTGITKEFLESIPLPNHGGRYAPIGHKEIMDDVQQEIVLRNFQIETELYRSTSNGNVANGSLMLNHNDDPDLRMMFFWGNSYDKSMRFMCGIGAYINSTGNYMFAGDVTSYSRKHTGNAKDEAMGMIQAQLSLANYYYDVLTAHKEEMKKVSLTINEMSKHVGIMFIEKQFLNKEQVCAIRDMLVNEESMVDGYAYNNVWNFYNIVAKVIRESHPRNWFYDQAEMHNYFVNYIVTCSTPAPVNLDPEEKEEEEVKDPNQLTLFDDEPENSVEKYNEVIVAEEDFLPNFDDKDGQIFVLPEL